MNDTQWKNFQQFSAYKKEDDKPLITGVQAFFISFFFTFYLILLIAALMG